MKKLHTSLSAQRGLILEHLRKATLTTHQARTEKVAEYVLFSEGA